MPERYDAVVIGSGLGGLAAAAMMSDAGAKVLVLERNAVFGGAATTYHRGPLTIEASLHETTFPWAPGDPKRALFDRLGLSAGVDLVPVPHLHEVRWRGLGDPFVLPHGFDGIEAALVARFPADRKGIHGLLTQVRRTQHLGEFMGPDLTVWGRVAQSWRLPLDLWAGLRDVKSSLSAVFQRYLGDNEALKFALCANLAYYSDDPDRLWWMAFAMAQGGYMKTGGYYIRGGSQRLTEALMTSITDRGGRVLAKCPAVGVILGPDGAICGVRHGQADGAQEVTVDTDIVFANAAPHVIRDLLPAQVRRAFEASYAHRPLSISLLSATLGLDRPPAEFGVSSYSTMLVPPWMTHFSQFPKATGLLASDPAGRMPVMCVVDYGQIESGFDTGGLHSMNIVCADHLDNWAGLGDSTYRQRREAWMSAIVADLDREWPGLAGAVRATNISTARTMQSHLNTPGGATYGFALTPPEGVPKGPPVQAKTPIPGLWLASAFTGFGGFTGAIGGGITAAQAALKAEGRKNGV